MGNFLSQYFEFKRHGTTFRREIGAGITTFLTMAYIIIVNPKILEAAGIPFNASMVATIVTAAFGTFLMGFYAKRPFAIAPYMGENAFIAYTVVVVLGYTWQMALAAIFISGVLFIILTALNLRQWLVDSVPQGLRYSFSVGIGLFMTFIGLNSTGIVMLGVPDAPVKIGDVTSIPVALAIFGFLLIAILMLRKVPGAILIGILTTTVLAFIFGVAQVPQSWMSAPPSLEPTFLQLDLTGVLDIGFAAVILTVFIMAFVDTMGTLIGVSSRAGFLDEKGNLPEIEKPMMADALATTFAGLVGTTTSGAYIESASGVEAGGRTGFTAIIVGLLFLVALFFAPFLTAVPPQAYGPALIVVGFLMLQPIKKIQLDDPTELFPALAVIILMSFTYNIGVGITSGFVLYPLFKLAAGRHREVNSGLWVLAVLSLLFFVFYPYS
ncbi:MAG: NCS2 family permease [Calditrichaeota bacterium]|nr:MAG: NCS2 family permease [Calditrichota bacterium]